MKKLFLSMAAMLLISMLASACDPAGLGALSQPTALPAQATAEPAQPTPGQPAPGGMPQLDPYERITAELRTDARVTVEPGEPVSQPFISVPGRILKVNGQDVQVFAFENVQAAQADADKLSPASGQGLLQVDWVDQANFWYKGDTIVIYIGKDAGVISALSKVMASQNTILNPVPGQGGLVTIPNSPFALAARAALSKQLGISVDQIEFVSSEETDWPDACLGLAQKGEVCAAVIVPGFKVILKTGGQTYEVRTNETGSAARVK